MKTLFAVIVALIGVTATPAHAGPGECIPSPLDFSGLKILRNEPSHFEYQVSTKNSGFEITVSRVNNRGKPLESTNGLPDAESLRFTNEKSGRSCTYLYSAQGDMLNRVWMNKKRAYLEISVGAGDSLDVVDPVTCKKLKTLGGDFLTFYRSKILFHGVCETVGAPGDFNSCECSPASVYILAGPGCDPEPDARASSLQTKADLGVKLGPQEKRKMPCPRGWW